MTEYNKFEHLSDVLNSSLFPAYILLSVGIVLFALGLIGCIGVIRDHKCLVRLVKFTLFVVVAVVEKCECTDTRQLVSCNRVPMGL